MNARFVLPETVFPAQPDPAGLDAQYWEGTRVEELRIQRCADCGRFQWLAEHLCQHCHSMELGFSVVAPRGTIYSWERVWHPVDPELADSCPYVVLVVELADAPGICVIGNLVGDGAAPIVIGQPVDAVFEHHDSYTLVQWKQTASRR
jgi:uncharacterized OB-fold protein